MYLFKPLCILAFAALCFSSFKPVDGCSIMHGGKFRYMADKEEVIVTINDSEFMESYQGGKYFIKAQLEWLSNCEYNLVITKVNAPGAMYTTGDEIDVKINHVEGNNIYYTASVKRVSWEGKFTKIDEAVSNN
jgi:hypothetical protein